MACMPRKLREEEAGAVVHVFARGNNRQRIFLGDDDRELYLTGLAHVVIRQRWSCMAYCLIHNHVHLLVQTPQISRDHDAPSGREAAASAV